MTDDTNPERLLFASTTQSFLEKEASLSRLRELHDAGISFDSGWWRRAAEREPEHRRCPQRHAIVPSRTPLQAGMLALRADADRAEQRIGLCDKTSKDLIGQYTAYQHRFRIEQRFEHAHRMAQGRNGFDEPAIDAGRVSGLGQVKITEVAVSANAQLLKQ